MATRCTVSVLNSDNSVNTVYGHWDGYLSGVGQLLLRHYNNENKARELLSGGDFSSLGQTNEVTSFYSRDRGETGTEQTTHEILQSQSYKKKRQEYNYLYNRDHWEYSRYNEAEWYNLDEEFTSEEL